MTKKIAYILVIGILAILLLMYFNRGGLVKPQISKVQTAPFSMVGKKYIGFGRDKALRELIRQTHEDMTNKVIQGTLTIVYRGNPDAEKDSVSVFVGVMVEDTLQVKLAKDYQIKYFPSMKTVRAEIKAHVSVAPNPEKINRMLVDFARKSGLTTDNVYIEKYVSEEHIISEIKVIE